MKNIHFLDYFTPLRACHIFNLKGIFFHSTKVLNLYIFHLFLLGWETTLSLDFTFLVTGRIKLCYFFSDTKYLLTFRNWICYVLNSETVSYHISLPSFSLFSLLSLSPPHLFLPPSLLYMHIYTHAHTCLFLSYPGFKFLENSLGHFHINLLVYHFFQFGLKKHIWFLF